MGRFLIEYFTPLTSGEQQRGVFSKEDEADVWATARSEAMRKSKKIRGRAKGGEASNLDEQEVEKTFWLSRPDGWVINSKMKWITSAEERMSAKDDTRIIYRMGHSLLSKHGKLFDSYWRQVFGPPSSLMHLLEKGLFDLFHCVVD